MANITNIPAPRVPFLDDRTGLMSREWYRFFLNLFTLVGNGTNEVSLTDLMVAPQAGDLTGEVTNLVNDAQLSLLMAQYDQAAAEIEGAYLGTPALPQDRRIEKSNQVMTWLSMQ